MSEKATAYTADELGDLRKWFATAPDKDVVPRLLATIDERDRVAGLLAAEVKAWRDWRDCDADIINLGPVYGAREAVDRVPAARELVEGA